MQLHLQAHRQLIAQYPFRKRPWLQLAVYRREQHRAARGEAVLGANVFRDLFAGIRDIVGGRSGAYESTLRDARATALEELKNEARALGADAVIGVDLDYETLGQGGTMLMVTASGTAVKLG